MPFPIDPLRPGQRIAVFGASGSGKSYWTKWAVLRTSSMRWVILDTKHDAIFDDWHPHDGLVDAKTLNRYWRKHPIVVLRPLPIENEGRVLDGWIGIIHEAFNNFGMVIDEVYQVSLGMKPGAGFTGLITRGRVRNQTVIMGAQRPAWVPKFMVSEASGYCIMSLKLEEDLVRVRGMIARRWAPLIEEPLPERRWFWYDTSSHFLREYGPVTIVKDETALDRPTRNRSVSGHLPAMRP